jgi:hypothetical protein
MGFLSPHIAPEFKDTSWPISNSRMPPQAPVIPHRQPLIYQPSEIEQNFNPYVTPPQTRMTYQQLPNPYRQQPEPLSFSPTSLSTITEKSTPVTGTAGSPVSLPSTDLSYYAPGSPSIRSGGARLSSASDVSPGVVDRGKPRPHANGSIAVLRSPGSFNSLGQEVTRPNNLKNETNKQAGANKTEDAVECSRPPAYRPR